MSTTAVPNNASLAYAVGEKDLQSGLKHLDKVHIEKAHETSTGGIHLGPTDKQADFPAQQVGQRSAIAAEREALSHPAAASSIGTLPVGNTLPVGGVPASGLAATGEVSVQSSVVMDTTQETSMQAPQEIQSLLQKLGTTTTQVDEYSRRQTEAISSEANQRIQRIIAETQKNQDELLRDASARSLEIEGEYAAKLKAFLQELDASKAGNLAALEKDLSFRQEQLLSNAREEIDGVHQAATAAKIAAMNQASKAVAADVDRLTEQVKTLGELEVERRMNSTTTTVITTETHTDSAVAAKQQESLVATNADLRGDRTLVTEPRANVRI